MIRPFGKAVLLLVAVAALIRNCDANLPAPVAEEVPSAIANNKGALITEERLPSVPVGSDSLQSPLISLHKACKTDSDCGPNAKCDLTTTQMCSCIQGAIPAPTTAAQNAGNVSAGCMKLLKLGDTCQSDRECRLGNPRLVCLAIQNKCRCAREFTLEGDNCVARANPAKPTPVVDGSDHLDRVFGGPHPTPKADHVYNDPELVRESRRYTAGSTEAPQLAPNTTVTIVVVVGFTLLFAGLCIAAYVKCQSMMRANNGQDEGAHGRDNQRNHAGRRSAYAASLSSYTSTSHYTTDTLNSASTSGSTSRVLGGNKGAELAKKLKFWSRQRREEPRLTISVLGQIYEKEWAMHRGKTMAAAAAGAEDDQFTHKEFDDSVSSSCCQDDDDDDDDGDITDCERQHRDVYLPPDIAYYISEQPSSKQNSRKPSTATCDVESATPPPVPRTPPPTAVSVHEEDEEQVAEQ